MSACDECGCVHGPGNTNRLCPKASNCRLDTDEERLAAALAAYDAEVIGRREEVSKAHAELGRVRAELVNAQSEIERLKREAECCWHCGDVLGQLLPKCDKCPEPGDCDTEGCSEPGCAP